MPPTVANTTTSVRMLERQSTAFASRSSRSSAGFSERDVNGPREECATSRTDELSLDHGVKDPTINVDSGVGVEKGRILVNNTLASGCSIQANVDAGVLSSLASRTRPFLSRRTQLRSGGRSRQTDSTANGSDPDVVSRQSLSLTLQWLITKACGGSAAENERGPHEANGHSALQTINEGDREANTASTTCAQLLARLPLSKIKIVIGEWINACVVAKLSTC